MTQLSEAEGRDALVLARRTVEAAVRREAYERGVLPPVFDERRGVFVTLTEGGQLRGCIGLPYPVAPLADAIVEAGASAALGTRGSSRCSRPTPLLRVEVTVLTTPSPIPGPAENRAEHVEVGRHGLIVRNQRTSGLLLPQVATEYGWTPTEFLDQTCNKAGLRTGCWRTPGVEVSLFEGQIFHE